MSRTLTEAVSAERILRIAIPRRSNLALLQQRVRQAQYSDQDQPIVHFAFDLQINRSASSGIKYRCSTNIPSGMADSLDVSGIASRVA
jgi:hypothetical protein